MGPNLLLPASASKSIRQGVAVSQQLMITILDSSTAFLSPYSAYFGVLSNFLARFSRLALRLLLVAFLVAQSLSFHPIFTQNPPSAGKFESQQFPPVDNALALPVLLLCDLILQNTEIYCSTSTTTRVLSGKSNWCKLFAYAASYPLAHVRPRAMPSRVPAVRYTGAHRWGIQVTRAIAPASTGQVNECYWLMAQNSS